MLRLWATGAYIAAPLPCLGWHLVTPLLDPNHPDSLGPCLPGVSHMVPNSSSRGEEVRFLIKDCEQCRKCTIPPTTRLYKLLVIPPINHQMWTAIDMHIVATLLHPNVHHSSTQSLSDISFLSNQTVLHNRTETQTILI